MLLSCYELVEEFISLIYFPCYCFCIMLCNLEIPYILLLHLFVYRITKIRFSFSDLRRRLSSCLDFGPDHFECDQWLESTLSIILKLIKYKKKMYHSYLFNH